MKKYDPKVLKESFCNILFPSIISISSAAAIHYNSTREAIELSGFFLKPTGLIEEGI
jgi:hypothetical protein